MENKEIIIDGVDVSGCEFYFYREGDEYPHRCSCYKDMYGCSVVCNLADCCENCVYKQLKRKEQECEELRQTLTEIKYIAEENIRIADLEGLNGVYRRGLAEQILQKIDEVKNDRQD